MRARGRSRRGGRGTARGKGKRGRGRTRWGSAQGAAEAGGKQPAWHGPPGAGGEGIRGYTDQGPDHRGYTHPRDVDWWQNAQGSGANATMPADWPHAAHPPPHKRGWPGPGGMQQPNSTSDGWGGRRGPRGGSWSRWGADGGQPGADSQHGPPTQSGHGQPPDASMHEPMHAQYAAHAPMRTGGAMAAGRRWASYRGGGQAGSPRRAGPPTDAMAGEDWYGGAGGGPQAGWRGPPGHHRGPRGWGRRSRDRGASPDLRRRSRDRDASPDLRRRSRDRDLSPDLRHRSHGSSPDLRRGREASSGLRRRSQDREPSPDLRRRPTDRQAPRRSRDRDPSPDLRQRPRNASPDLRQRSRDASPDLRQRPRNASPDLRQRSRDASPDLRHVPREHRSSPVLYQRGPPMPGDAAWYHQGPREAAAGAPVAAPAAAPASYHPVGLEPAAAVPVQAQNPNPEPHAAAHAAIHAHAHAHAPHGPVLEAEQGEHAQPPPPEAGAPPGESGQVAGGKTLQCGVTLPPLTEVDDQGWRSAVEARREGIRAGWDAVFASYALRGAVSQRSMAAAQAAAAANVQAMTGQRSQA